MDKPAIPGYELLYSLTCDLGPRVDYGVGPLGRRIAIPIIGGSFEGPRMKVCTFTIVHISVAKLRNPNCQGEILNQGADWGRIDSKTGVFHADTRYTLKTEDSPPAYLYLQTRGPLRPDGVSEEASPSGLQLHILIETGDARYYWLNDTCIVGISRMFNDNQIRIDAYAFTMQG